MMNDNKKNLTGGNVATTEAEKAANTPPAQDSQHPLTPEQLRANMKKLACGTMKLENPIRCKSEDVTELAYDFSKLSGWEYAEAMDGDPDARNVFRVTAKQAFNLFAKAVDKCMPDIDAVDVKRQLSLVDTVKAVQLGTLFLVTCSQVANSNTSNE